MTYNYATEKGTPYERAYLKHKRAGRKHDPESWNNTQMAGTKELIRAFICDNADRGHAFNLIIIGDVLYLDEGNDGKRLYYYQLAIRLPGGVYIINMRSKHDNKIEYISKVLQHNQAWIKYIMLPTLDHKKDHGQIDPDQLRKAIMEEGANSAVKRALITYDRQQKQATAIENINQLHITFERLNYPDRSKYYDELTITEAIRVIQRTNKVCATLDKYLDILTQFPELEP